MFKALMAAVFATTVLIAPVAEARTSHSGHHATTAKSHATKRTRGTRSARAAAPAASGGTVSYNTNTGKYHNAGCRYWDCSNCISLPRSQAESSGSACKKCGG